MTTPSIPTARYLWRLALAAPGLAITVFTLSMLDALLPLAFGLILRAFFDTLSGEAVAGFTLWSLVALYLVTRLALQATELGYAGLSAYQYYLLDAYLKRNLFRSLLHARGAAARLNSGEIVNRIAEDTEAITEPIWNATAGGIVVAVCFTLAIMVTINAALTLIAFLPMLIAIAVMRYMSPRIDAYHQNAREASENVSGLLAQLLNAVLAIQAAGRQDDAVAHFVQASDQRRAAVVKNATFDTLLHNLNGGAVDVATGIVLIFAANLMVAGSFTVGDFALFVAYVSMGDASVGALVQWASQQMSALRRAEVSLGRLLEFTPSEPDLALAAHDSLFLRSQPPIPPESMLRPEDRLATLEVRGLSHRNAGGRTIEGVDLAIARGELVVITGRVGSGKTTVLETLLGLLPASAGEIRWNGRLVTQPHHFFVPPRCAYTPQIPRLFSETLQENVCLGRSVADDELQAAIDSALLEPDVERLEHGLLTVVGPRGVRLSGGQVQRVGAARMFLRRSELLVFDDLSSALDVETERILWARLFDTAAVAPTCLVVSHRREIFRRADRILVMRDGVVLDQGTLSELLGRCPEMQDLWQMETVEGASPVDDLAALTDRAAASRAFSEVEP